MCYKRLKSVLDFIGAIILLIIFCPILLLVAIFVWIFIDRPIIFKQQRPGLGGKPFIIYKFRTMKVQYADENGLSSDKERMTRFGFLLRKLSLDELPELLNVLKGDMSLIGPRPLLMDYLPLYSSEQSRRHEVKPGITGWAVVNGRNSLSWYEKFRLDVWYVNNMSFWLDLKIISLTIANVITRKGISYEGHVTMPKFDG